MAPSFYDLPSYLHRFPLTVTLFLVSFTTPVRTLCRNNERYALLQLKQSFSITGDASSDASAYPKVASWGLLHRGENASASTDCCSWDGVECDRETGHVIGLDLSSSCLKGSINSSSTLFHLLHLQKLNLGDNNFNYSQIPAELRLLAGLTYLNLSNSVLSGKIPSELTELSNLTSLDLGNNNDPSTGNELLELHPSCIMSLAQNLTRLQTLVLSEVNLSSTLPNIWANFSWLTHLDLRDCSLWGPVQTSLGELTQLTYLDLGGNTFSGQIPSWFGKLHKLQYIDLGYNHFHGTIPGSIFSNLVNLRHLNLRDNHLTGTVYFDIFLGLKHLTYLHLTGNNLSLVISSGNATNAKFTHLALGNCHLQEFPDFLGHQDRLNYLNLFANNIQGQIPKWIGDVSGKTLNFLILSENYLTGFEQPSMLSSFSSLKVVDLRGNKIQGPLPIPPPSIIGYNVFDNLLTGEIFPSVCDLSSLVFLVLSFNNLSGTIPRCLGNFSDSLLVLNLANNSFSGSIPETFSTGSKLRMIDLSHNRLEGGIPRSLANCTLLERLDLSENRISDSFPFWLGNLPELQLLNLRSNQLFGSIQSYKKYSQFPSLRILDLSCNNFTGILPMKLLQRLSSLKAFSSRQFRKAFSRRQLVYLQSSLAVENIIIYFAYQLILANKGIYLKYSKFPSALAAVDLSSNGFRGHIPPAIGTLKMINVLNLSNNDLFGSIPLNLGNLMRLESLDLSHNKLSGEIPVQLVQLTFLAYFDVSHNHLEGAIPEGKQFDTFQNESYAGNLGLCGRPLTRKCEDAKASSPQNPPDYGKDHGKGFAMNVGLMIVLMGYGSGLVVGLVIGHRFTTQKGGWFIRKFGSRQRTHKRRRR